MRKRVVVVTNCHPAVPPMPVLPVDKEAVYVGLAFVAACLALGVCAWAAWGI